MSKNNLFDDNESEDETVVLETANDYAKRYDKWRQKEELYKLEQKYGDKVLNSDASLSSDSEDEEPPEMSTEMEEQFLKTLSLLKTKDPRIYDPSFKCFEDEEQANKDKKEDEIDENPKPKKEVNSLAAAFAESDDDDGEEIFKVEKKAPQAPVSAKKDKLKAYLTGEVEHVDQNVDKDLAPLRALWSDPNITEGEAFLRDYILNKRYLNNGEVGDTSNKLLDDEALETDEKLVEEQGNFERAYNFRFEEPDQEYLKRYPRTMNYIRPKDDRRAKKRVEVRTRKDEEKQRKMEEIGRLKALKLKEIQEKIAKIKEVTGNEDLAFKDEDIEGDFDPAEHDRRMRAIFDENYYGEADDVKPVFPDLDDELEIENWDNFDVDSKEKDQECDDTNETAYCEDEDFNMDADYDPKKARTTLLEEIQETLGKKRRNRKKKSKLAKLLSTEKEKFIPMADKTYSEYMEEYYKMDCEDVIGGELPTRFKYRDTVANDFGLSVEEILLADDKELNQWASLKKAVKYRQEHVEKSEVNTYRLKAADEKLKRKILPSLFKDLPEEPEVVVAVKKKKKKNKTPAIETDVDVVKESPEIQTENNEVEETQNNESDQAVVNESKPKKKKKHKKSSITKENGVEEHLADKTIDHNQSSESCKPNNEIIVNESKDNNENSVEIVNNEKIGKKKKKPKQNGFIVEDIQTNDNITSHQNEKKNNDKSNNEKNNLKRKLPNDNETVIKKKKKKNKMNKGANGNFSAASKNKLKNKHTNKDTSSDNPLSKLSDERLKAYGLNPKKYRSFLKYKKF